MDANIADADYDYYNSEEVQEWMNAPLGKPEEIERFKLEIERISNGYILIDSQDVKSVLQDKKTEVETSYELLWEIINIFGLAGSKHDPKRISVNIIKKGVDY